MDKSSSVSASEQTAHAIGELKGLLGGISQMISANAASLNRRIDDMHASNTRRLDDISSSITRRIDDQDDRLDVVELTANTALSAARENAVRIESSQRVAAKTAGGVGAVSGTLVAGAIELIKAVMQRL